MYRQLHKWDDALAVATSKNHPQAHALRKEYFDYLINTKQEEIAGELKEREGDYMTAVNLYLKGGYPTKAADLIQRHDLKGDDGLCRRVAKALDQKKQYEKAGEFLENLGMYDGALESYCKGHSYFKAVELARLQFPSHVVSLEGSWGDWLARQKQMDAASNHYIQAGAYLKAINAAIEARQWTKAVQILDQIDGATAKPYYKRIAQHYSETKRYSEAERYFIQGQLPQEAVQMYTSAGLWDKAHKIAVTYMPDSEVGLLYVTQAQLMESQGKFKDAERLYLTVDEPDLAISMYKKNRQYDDMIRLVSQCRQELLPETHIHLASQFQSEGNFKLAEKHYIAAKEWKPVVSMYRENDMWEDCLRVAKQHGGQNAYKQVAYAFAVSVGGDAGVKLLAKRGLGEQAVDYAIERGEFTEAFHIAEKSCKGKLGEVHLQYAMALEDEGRFERAEEEFIKAHKPKEAIDMYIHQQDFDAGMKVAEQHEPAAIADVQEAKARKLAEGKDFMNAEMLFIQAKKPEEAVKMYKDAQQWDEAIRLAKKFLPRMVPDLQQERHSQMGGTPAAEGADYLIDQAKMYENQKQYNAAIDGYLKLTKDNVHDYSRLEVLWENAVTLSIQYVNGRVPEIVSTVSRRLVEIGRVDEAADMFLGIDDYESAIDVYLNNNKFEKAKAVAEGSQNPQHWIQYVEQKYQGHLVRNDRISDLGDRNPDAAIEMYVNRGDWDEVYNLAQEQGEQAVLKFATIHAKSLVNEFKYKEALAVLAQRGVTHDTPVNFGLYKRIAQEILADENAPEIQERTTGEPKPELEQLKQMLYNLLTGLRSSGAADNPVTQEFETLSTAAHLMALKEKCQAEKLHKLAAKQATSLLRYVNVIPIDRAFYEAGYACISAEVYNNAFVFLNRFVDVSDLIEEPDDNAGMDNSDFLETDIPLQNVHIPKKQSYSEDLREEARDWVLDKAMSNDVGQQLSQRSCQKCNARTFEAGLKCHSCGTKAENCIITGFPIDRQQKVNCTSCRSPANRDDWNGYILRMKTCPWCGSLQDPMYDSGLGGY